MDIINYGMRPDGLGIIVIEFCFLLSTNKKIRAFVSNQHHMLYDLKRIFNISDERLTIEFQENCINHPASNDLMKTFSSYYAPDTINVFGRTRSTGRRGKPCIGLAMHHGAGISGNNTDPLGETQDVKEFPYNKYATYDTYSKIIKLVTDAGYDVITFNNKNVDVEHKAFLLNELCECLIGYEGGAAHLAHMLKVPTIILPWNYWYDGEDHWKDGSVWDPDRVEAHKYHIDSRTYFLKSQEEILSWDSGKLKTIIDILANNGGNNIWINETVKWDEENVILDKNNNIKFARFPKATADFIKEHIKNIKIG